MVQRPASAAAPHPDAVEFVRFCYHRRRVGGPELYDEMCAVAGRGLFRGLSTDDLSGIGVGFSLFDMPALANLAARVVAEELALRRPMKVVLTGDLQPIMETPAATEPQSAGTATPSGSVPRPGEERSFEVPQRLALAASSA